MTSTSCRSLGAVLAAVVVAVLTVLLSGCGSSGGSDDPPADPMTRAAGGGPHRSTAGGVAPSAAPPSAARSYSSATGVVAALADGGLPCTGARATAVPDLPHRPAAVTTCRVGSQEVAVAWFATSAQRTGWETYSHDVYGSRTHYVIGPDWAAATTDGTTLTRIAAALGGTMHWHRLGPRGRYPA